MLDRVGRTEESLAAGREGYAITQRLGVARTYGGALLGHVAKGLFDLGRWDEAAAAADEGLELDPVGAAAIWLHVNRARVDTNQGRFAEAAAHLRQAEALAATGTGPDRHGAALASATAELAAWQGQLDVARTVADAALATIDATAPLDPATGWLARHALRAEGDAATSARAGHDDDALREAERRVAPIADVLVSRDDDTADGDPRRIALAGLCRGEIDRVRGVSSTESWARTAAAWQAIGRPAPTAYARFRSAEALLAGRGDRSSASAALRGAHDTTVRLGPRRFVSKNRGAGPRRQDRHGHRHGARRRRRGPATGSHRSRGRGHPAEEDGQRVMKREEITVRVGLNRGASSATVWTCDLSHEYVSINADYRS